VPQAGVLARAELSNRESSRAEFGHAMVLIPGQLEEWLNKILPSTLDRSRMERREQVDLPFEMIREAVVNALIHRDYNIAGQKVQLVVNADTITIKSPGGPIAPITLEQMRSFTAPMKSRNPVLHYVFARMGMAEEQGYGLSSLKKARGGTRPPSPELFDGRRLPCADDLPHARERHEGTRFNAPRLTVEEQEGWKFVAGRTGTTQSEYAGHLGVTARTAQRHLTSIS